MATRVGQGFGVVLIVLGVLGTFVRVPYVSLWTALMGLFVYRTAQNIRDTGDKFDFTSNW